MKTLLFAVGLAALSIPGRAQDQDLGSLHQFNFLSQRGEKFRIMLHTRTRFFNNITEFSQFRAGPILYWDWKPKLQVLAGYYVGTQRSNATFVTIQRPWAGMQIRVWSGERIGLDWRTLVERHIFSGPGDFTRVRTRAMANFQPRAGWQPYASAEALALKGHVIGRYTTGVNYANARGDLYGFGYEFRQDVGKPGTHIIATLVQFKISGPRRREKPDEAEAPQ
jgi:hypothetical protein